ncbi:MAG: hypothetical protein WA705_15220 [Candidatus Ozemobacteraceae bacterium]
MRRHLYFPFGLLLLGLTASSPAAIQTWEEDKVEQEIQEALKADRKDRDAIERMIELCESRGDFTEAANWLVMLSKAGTPAALLEERLTAIRAKIAGDEDIPMWESRLSIFRDKEDWSKALKEIKKLAEKYSYRIGRLKNTKLKYLEKQIEASGTSDAQEYLDPNIDSQLNGYTSRLQELIELESELKEKKKPNK